MWVSCRKCVPSGRIVATFQIVCPWSLWVVPNAIARGPQTGESAWRRSVVVVCVARSTTLSTRLCVA